jgi:NAD(P)H-hydrate epimerase
MSGPEILTVAEMYRADAAAADSGIASIGLMENAGAAVADAVRRRWPAGRVVVLCGPGNNGGDGFVAARHLAAAGWTVSLGLAGERDRLKGDAAWAAGAWSGPVLPLSPALLDGADVIVDAVFGAGLSRPVDGLVRATLEAASRAGVPLVAVDVPSGLSGDTGAVLGFAPKATVTVTFFRAKPGHLLLPGRALCGSLEVADIGIPAAVLGTIAPQTLRNGPGLWLAGFPWPRLDSHKYARGHAVVDGGAVMTGAARLAARAALRAGAGLVTIASPPSAFQIYALSMPTVIVAPVADQAAFAALAADSRRNAFLVGPGAGAATPGESAALRVRTLAVLQTGRAAVIDADVFSAFRDEPEALLAALHPRCVLTPHEGEFARLFGPAGAGDKLARARAAAARAGAVVVLKGADTVVAAADGRAAINANAPPDLATAGSGDVLAGVVLGLLAQGMVPFEAACAAVWLHGAAAAAHGPGLIAEDLPDRLPQVLRGLRDGVPHLSDGG